MKHLYSAGIIVYRIENDTIKYLLLEYNAKHWDFPKGKIEKNETKEEAALRELQEETGLSCSLLADFEEHFSYLFHDYDKQLAQKTVYFFIGYTTATTVTLSNEHCGYEWLPFKKAVEKLTYENAKKLLKKAHKHIIQEKNNFL